MTEKKINSERQLFENWARWQGYNLSKETDYSYTEADTNDVFAAWLARAEIEQD